MITKEENYYPVRKWNMNYPNVRSLDFVIKLLTSADEISEKEHCVTTITDKISRSGVIKSQISGLSMERVKYNWRELFEGIHVYNFINPVVAVSLLVAKAALIYAKKVEEFNSIKKDILKKVEERYKLISEINVENNTSEERKNSIKSIKRKLVETRVFLREDLKLLSQDESMKIEQYRKELAIEYNDLVKLDKSCIMMAALGGLIGGVMDVLLIGIPKRTPKGTKAGPLSNYVRKWFEKKYPPEKMEKLANSVESKVPFDAQDNRNTSTHVEGLSAYYHRLLSLGHDPFLGIFVGVYDILTGKMTTIDKNGKLVSQVMQEVSKEDGKNIFTRVAEAIVREIRHLKSDVTTSMGLPAPFSGIFNLFQFGEIGDEKQTVAEIVQGMYYEGYDFIHWCSLSIPVMVTEVFIRISYAIKRKKEGYKIRESMFLAKNPKLKKMLFIGSTLAAAINAGKVFFSKNPTAINCEQWRAFIKYSINEMKLKLITEPKEKRRYVGERLSDKIQDIIDFDDIAFC